MALRAVRMEVRARALLDGCGSFDGWDERYGDEGLADRRRQDADVTERRQLIREAVRRRVDEAAVELTELEAECLARRIRRATRAVASSRAVPIRRADRVRLPSPAKRRVGLRIVPLVRVAGPAAIVVADEKARLDVLATELERLHDDTADRQIEITVVPNRDRLAIGERDEPLLLRTVAPELRVDGVRNEAWRWFLRVRRVDTSRRAEKRRKRIGWLRPRRHHLVHHALVERDRVDLPVDILGERHPVHLGHRREGYGAQAQ